MEARRYDSLRLATALILGFCVLGLCPLGAVAADVLTPAQKTDMARRLLSADPAASELGVLDDPFHFAGMGDAEVRRKMGEADRGITSAQQKHYQSMETLKSYENQLVSQGKTTRKGLPTYNDSTGRLVRLRSVATRSGGVLRDYLIAKTDLMEEMVLRENPDRILADEAELQRIVSGAKQWSKDFEQMKKALLKGDQQMWERAKEIERGARRLKQQQGQTVIEEPLFPDNGSSGRGRGSGGRQSASNTKKVFSVRKPVAGSSKTMGSGRGALVSQPSSGVSLDVTYEDLWGPNVDPRSIESIEMAEIKKLPSELKTGVPKEIQRLFFYGGYEKLPRDQKKHVRHIVKEYKQAIKSRQQLQRAFGDLYNATQNSIAPEGLVSQTSANAAGSAAFLLLQFTQGLTEYVYNKARRAKWEEAYNKIAAEIPEGKKEKVLFIEDIERCQLDMISWVETRGITAFRGEIELETKDEVFEKLVNLHKSSHPGFWRYRKLYTAYVVGTGEKEEEKPPSVKEAFEAGAEIGRLARGGKNMEDIMRKTYTKYNKWEETREAFKRGYSKAAQGLID